MNLSQQVVSLPLAKRLKELGVKQEGYFIWASLEQGEEVFFPTTQDEINREHDRYATTGGGHQYEVHCAAFTVAELINLLQSVAEEDIVIAWSDDKVADHLAEILCTKLQSPKESAGSGHTQ